MPILKKRLPKSRLLAVQFSLDFKGKAEAAGAHAVHYYSDKSASDKSASENSASENSASESVSFEAFLNSHIENGEEITLIPWPPSLRFWDKVAKELLQSLQTWLEREKASQITEQVFQKRWISNALRSLTLPHSLVSISKPMGAVFLAIAGPSLESAIEELLKKEERDSFFLIAVSSALEALLARGLYPDLLVASDGGYWARPLLEGLQNQNIPFFYQLGAAIPSFLDGKTLIACSNGKPWQDFLLNARGLKAPVFFERGTVSAFALDIALSFAPKRIYLMGLDLEVGKIKTHARPHAFERLIARQENRLYPAWTWYEERAQLYRESSALDIYKKWYIKKSEDFHKLCRIYSPEGKGHLGLKGCSKIEASVQGRGSLAFNVKSSLKKWKANELLKNKALDKALLKSLCAEIDRLWYG